MNPLDTILTLLRRGAAAGDWVPLLAEEVVFEALGVTLNGRDAVAKRLGATPFHNLVWSQLDREGIVLAGSPAADRRDRGMVISLSLADRHIARFAQQNMALAPQPGAPMVMDAALRSRFDQALALKHPMTLAYVDPDGKPHVSLRGSLRTFGPDRLCLWVRSAQGGLAAAVKNNPQVALLFRDETTRATYQMQGRAHVADDEPTRAAIFEGCPVIERQHDFARLGAAVIIELDFLEGYAGLGPSGQIEPVRLVRPRHR
jgi:hypothetical protein